MSEQLNLSAEGSIQLNNSSTGSVVVLYDNLEIKERVDKIWGQVFSFSNRVLRDAKLYGYILLPEVPELDLHTMVYRLHMLNASMKFAIEHGPGLGLDHIHINMMLNAQEQLSRMRRLCDALDADDLEEYNSTIRELEN